MKDYGSVLMRAYDDISVSVVVVGECEDEMIFSRSNDKMATRGRDQGMMPSSMHLGGASAGNWEGLDWLISDRVH